jgi:hypothetical protein
MARGNPGNDVAKASHVKNPWYGRLNFAGNNVPRWRYVLIPRTPFALAMTLLLASCTGRSAASTESPRRSSEEAGRAASSTQGRSSPAAADYYVCSAEVVNAFGQFRFMRSFSLDGRLFSIHAEWSAILAPPVPFAGPPGSPLERHHPYTGPTAFWTYVSQPDLKAVWNMENGHSFNLEDGGVFVAWEFVPLVKPKTVHFRISVNDLPTVEKPHEPPARGELNSISDKNSYVLGLLSWGDFAKFAHRDSDTLIKVDALSASKSWKKQLFPNQLEGLTAVGYFTLQRTIRAGVLRSVESQLLKLAQETAVQPVDIPHRCVREEPITVSN